MAKNERANGNASPLRNARRTRVGLRGFVCTGALIGSFALVGCSDAAVGGSNPNGDTPPANGGVDSGKVGSTSDAGKTGSGDAGTKDTGAGQGDDAGEPVDAAPPITCTAGLPSSINDLKSMVIGDTTSSKTPMGVHFETPAQHTISAADLAYFADATQTPPIPASTSGLHIQAFPVNLYPSGTPKPADINQHAIGDCDGDTAMAIMAYVYPALIPTLMTDNKNDTYTVAMFDPMGKPLSITVDNKFLADSGNHIAAVSGKNDTATWATVLEKAVMKYNVVFAFIDDIGGIGSEFLTPLFTGQGSSFAFDRGVLTPAQLTRAVTASLAAGKFISGGFGNEKTLGTVKAITAHGYAVFVPPDSATMVAMRNPWGVSPLANGNGYDTTTDGILNIPPTADWAKEIDLRIIDPGTACSAGTTAPYVPKLAKVQRSEDVRITESHVAR